MGEQVNGGASEQVGGWVTEFLVLVIFYIQLPKLFLVLALHFIIGVFVMHGVSLE